MGSLMKYTSTRDDKKEIQSAEAILMGLSPDGGLFVPIGNRKINLESYKNMPYADVATAVLEQFLPDYSEGFLRDSIHKIYDNNFNNKAGYLVPINEHLFSLELWHGPTSAFKDYALQLLPQLLVEAKKMLHDDNKTQVLVATSGDTGTAALQGFCNVEGTGIAVFYPHNGTSEIQRLQMATQKGDNIDVIAIRGNFDDAQRGVKLAFNDLELARNLDSRKIKLSSANSINWGRLVPQIVYYITSYICLCDKGTINAGDLVDYCVPTGNFGDIMAGYYAKRMGLPIGQLICASNQNNVLADFLETGHYNANRDFYKTSSPSMDILVSSNLERLLYHESGCAAKVRGWMEQLANKGAYHVGDEVLSRIRGTFTAGWATEEQVSEEIQSIFQEYQYLSDPHTAVAFRVAHNSVNYGKRPTVVLSTASPYKFCSKVLASLGKAVPDDEFDALEALETYSGISAPGTIKSLKNKKVRFEYVIDPGQVVETVLSL